MLKSFAVAMLGVALLAGPALSAEGDVYVTVEREQEDGSRILVETVVVPAQDDPTPTPTPEPTAAPTPEPSAAPTPEPTATPDPTPTPTPEPTEPPGPVDEDVITIEAQDWWDGPTGGGAPDIVGHPGRHLHMEVTVPTVPVSGTVEVPYRIIAHNNATGTLTRIKFQDDNGSGPNEQVQHVSIRLDQGTGVVAEGSFTIDTTTQDDGWRLWRFYAFVDHDNGNEQAARPITPVYVDNGKSDKDANDKWMRPTAWYREEDPERDWGYCWAAMDREDAVAALDGVSGTWKPTIKITVNTQDVDVDGWSVHVDPAFHAQDPGIVVDSGNGEFSGAVNVDTSSLDPGTHALVIRAIQQVGERRHECVGKFAFVVE